MSMATTKKTDDNKNEILLQDISILGYEYSNLLRRKGINTIWALTKLTQKDILNLSGIGEIRCQQLMDKLKDFGNQIQEKVLLKTVWDKKSERFITIY